MGMRAMCMVLALGAGPALALEEVLTPAGYFECQIAAQQATIEGMQERHKLQQRKDVDEPQRRAAADKARARVTLALYGCGRQNGATLGAYAHRHADELAEYLRANPQVKARLEATGRRIAALSQQMTQPAPSAKR